MINKPTLLVVMLFISMNSSLCENFVFDAGMYTRIKGNTIALYLYNNCFQCNPSYVFEHTRVVECEGKKFKQIGTLGSLQKDYNGYWTRATVDRFETFGKMNNAIYCEDVEQLLNYYDNLEGVGAIIYNTQNLKECAFLKKCLEEQRAAGNKVKQK